MPFRLAAMRKIKSYTIWPRSLPALNTCLKHIDKHIVHYLIMSYVVQRPNLTGKISGQFPQYQEVVREAKAGKSVGGGSGFSGTTASSRYAFSEDLDSLQVDMQKKFTEKQGYEPFEDVPLSIVKGVRELFLTLYKVYSMKPFLEPLEDGQVGMQDETLEMTFGEQKNVIK